jgi:hypothetical protein
MYLEVCDYMNVYLYTSYIDLNQTQIAIRIMKDKPEYKAKSEAKVS